MVFYRLKIRTIQDAFITFTVDKYKIVDDGTFVKFTDRVTGKIYRFPLLNVNIEEIEGEL